MVDDGSAMLLNKLELPRHRRQHDRRFTSDPGHSLVSTSTRKAEWIHDPDAVLSGRRRRPDWFSSHGS